MREEKPTKNWFLDSSMTRTKAVVEQHTYKLQFIVRILELMGIGMEILLEMLRLERVIQFRAF